MIMTKHHDISNKKMLTKIAVFSHDNVNVSAVALTCFQVGLPFLSGVVSKTIISKDSSSTQNIFHSRSQGMRDDVLIALLLCYYIFIKCIYD